jgi:hypothetical protein
LRDGPHVSDDVPWARHRRDTTPHPTLRQPKVQARQDLAAEEEEAFSIPAVPAPP